jgi:hypothetical protein
MACPTDPPPPPTHPPTHPPTCVASIWMIRFWESKGKARKFMGVYLQGKRWVREAARP